jgi:hypothetical protein
LTSSLIFTPIFGNPREELFHDRIGGPQPISLLVKIAIHFAAPYQYFPISAALGTSHLLHQLSYRPIAQASVFGNIPHTHEPILETRDIVHFSRPFTASAAVEVECSSASRSEYSLQTSISVHLGFAQPEQRAYGARDMLAAKCHGAILFGFRPSPAINQQQQAFGTRPGH